MCQHKLIHHTLGGDFGKACQHYNSLGLADYTIAMQANTTFGTTTTVFKVPNEKVPAVWRKLGRDPLTCPVQVKD